MVTAKRAVQSKIMSYTMAIKSFDVPRVKLRNPIISVRTPEHSNEKADEIR